MSVTIYMYFLRVGNNVYKVGCGFQACRGESVKYQTCLIFLRPLPTLVDLTDSYFIHLATAQQARNSEIRLNPTVKYS